MKFGFKQTAVSITVFTGILIGLATVDDRVREKFGELIYGGGVASWTSRAGDLGDTLLGAARSQSIENAPLAVFAAVSALLVVFMLRT
jgi:hypothetical protein